ncbi:MAG: hypothetical protein IPJ41_18620 [Phycisphaerales bacterium]|nr:hypothetical protein [Phycisphaerales bacterium]
MRRKPACTCFLALFPILAGTALGQSKAAPSTKPPSTSREQPQHDAPEPLPPTWIWLETAPITPYSILEPPPSPGQAAFDALIMDINVSKPDGLARADLAARLGAQLAALEPAPRKAITALFKAHEDLAAEVVFLLGDRDDIPAAYGVLQRLIDAHGERVAELAPLAAAIAAVYDRPGDRRINENTVSPIDPVELFGYYAGNERAMQISLRETPAPLLTYLASATGSVAELDWARQRYARDKNIGNRYKEISYDTRAFRETDAQKRVTASGAYTLESIRQNGGVCADQAYFAETVGKAVGVPACYVRGRSGDASHAWVGFVEQSGRRALRWNFSAGRYKEFEDTQGKVVDPQTGDSVPDAYLSIEAYSASLTPEQRRESIALADAARRAASLAWARGGDGSVTPDLTARQLNLLEAALRRDAGNLDGWILARNIVASPTATLEQKERWTQAVDRLAGNSSPDFAMEILTPVFAAVADPAARAHLWDWAAGRFASRPDLAARARLEQVRTLVEQGRKPEAVGAAKAVFDAFPEVGPPAIESLDLAARLLSDEGRGQEVVKLYEQAFRRLRQPQRMAKIFLVQTSWYQVGSRYAAALEASGDNRTASDVRRRLDR